MATTGTTQEKPAAAAPLSRLMIALPIPAPETTAAFLGAMAASFGGVHVTVATPDTPVQLPPGIDTSNFQAISYTPAAVSTNAWTLTAADFVNAHELLQSSRAAAILVLGAEAHSLDPAALRRLADEALSQRCDLVVPRYALPPRAGLVNSAILYPVSRSLFGAAPRFPLAVDVCLSQRMAERLATVAQRFTSANQPDALVWPVAEAATAGYSIGQVDVGPRTLPQPNAPDLNTLLAQVAGSLFADVDAKAAFWQRARVAPPSRASASGTTTTSAAQEEVRPMIEGFRLAQKNLQEIWSLVLPPQSLLGLKRLAAAPDESFVMADSLWARIVFDFLLAYRLRTLNRSHLLGALTPLYLAWVASHLLQTGQGVYPERHIEAVAAAFEADKAYLVSRWRWPDRFNP